jgi:ABC-type transport system substrate-binding protein
MRQNALLTSSVAALALLAAACGSDGDSSSPTTEAPTPTTAASTSTTAGGTSTTGATSSTTAGTPECATEQLQAELGPTDAGAGQIYAPLILRNTSSSTCLVRGFPGVSVLDADGGQLGDPATREGAEGGEVLLQPGGVASSTLHTTNQGIGGQACLPTSAQMKVFPPDQTAELTFPAQFTVCGGFSVTSLVAGDTGVA